MIIKYSILDKSWSHNCEKPCSNYADYYLEQLREDFDRAIELYEFRVKAAREYYEKLHGKEALERLDK